MKATIETYLEILQHFKDNAGYPTRNWMSSPFSANGKAIATDAMKLVATPFVPGLPDYSEKVRNVYPIAHDIDKMIQLSELREKLNAWPQVDCFDEVTEECGACHGNGTVVYEFLYQGRGFEMDAECPICDGKGSTATKSKTPNGKKEPDEDKVFRIGNNSFRYDLVKSLLFVAEILQSDIRVLNQTDDRRPTLFAIGEVEVLLMSLYNHTGLDIAQSIEL